MPTYDFLISPVFFFWENFFLTLGSPACKASAGNHCAMGAIIIISLVEVTTRQGYCHGQLLPNNLERAPIIKWYRPQINRGKTYGSVGI